jgi:hypothetical protein
VLALGDLFFFSFRAEKDDMMGYECMHLLAFRGGREKGNKD